MAKKETSQNEAPQKIVTKYDRKVQQRKEAEAKEKKQKQLDKLVGILVIAVIAIAIAAIPVSKYMASHSTYVTVGGHDITRVEYDYYFNLSTTEYMNSYGSYLSYMGLDLSGDLSKQQYSDTMTWQDYFDRMTIDMIQQNKSLADAAEAAGFTYDASAEYEAFKATVKESALSVGVSTSRYYRESFGRYATASNLRPYIEEGYLVAAYYEEVSDSKAPSEAEILAYYEENKDTYDSVDYLITEIVADVPEAETVTNADGTTSTVEPEEAAVTAAMEAAKAEADAALEVIDTEGEAKTSLNSEISYQLYEDWLFDTARVAGDTTILEDTNNNKYFVLKFIDRYLDDDITANIRVIMSSTVSCEDMLAELEAAGNTEEAFIELVEKYSEDAYSNTNGGLYEELSASYLDDEMSQWLNEAGRKAGDIFSYTDAEAGANYVLYYVSEGRPSWEVSIESTLVSELMNEYIEELKAPYEVEDPKGNLNYLKVLEEQGLTEGTTEATTAQ
ncbi:MAG: hypothetical protein IJ405_08630 [Lachnospiraceae bacterium]|nr:hypothetical protein [Lachnospiraceae bacterium]